MRRPLGVNDVGKNDDTAKTVCFFVFSLWSSRQKSPKLLTIQKEFWAGVIGAVFGGLEHEQLNVFSRARTEAHQMIDDKELIHKATDVINPRRLSPTVEVGGVAFILADIGIELLHPKLETQNSL